MSDVIEFDGVLAGSTISEACRKATIIASHRKKLVHFEFNGTDVTVQPGESPETVQERWRADYDAAAKAYREHPDRIKEAEERERKEREADAAVMVETAKTEEGMREAKVPWPRTEKQLNEYVESLVKREHSYGTCVYAMSMAATAAFYYVAHQLGVTGFQSGCADMDIIRRTRNMKGPFMIINGEDALYPQYDLYGRLDKAMHEWKPWLKEEATKKLAEAGHAHPDVVEHWKGLASVEVGSEDVTV